VGDLFNVFDFVEGEVEAREVGEVFEAADVRDQVVVEVEVGERCGEHGQAFDFRDAVLAQAEAGYGVEAGEVEGGDRGDAGVDCVDFSAVEGVVVK